MAGPKANGAGGKDGKAKDGAGTTPDAPELDEFLAEMKQQFAALGKQFKEVAEKVGDEAQYHVDRELARALAKHPDLYAEVRKTIRQVQRTVDKAAETFGVKK